MGGFYEDDEPIEKVLAILARGFDGVTAPPPLPEPPNGCAATAAAVVLRRSA
jgi:hypothetical protein